MTSSGSVMLKKARTRAAVATAAVTVTLCPRLSVVCVSTLLCVTARIGPLCSVFVGLCAYVRLVHSRCWLVARWCLALHHRYPLKSPLR